jgi:hypothetical protein
MDYNIPQVKKIMGRAMTLDNEAKDMVAKAKASDNQVDRDFYITEAQRLTKKSRWLVDSAKMWEASTKIGSY